MRKIVGSLLLLIAVSFQAQENQKQTYVKGNSLFLPLGMLNVGVEHQLNEKFTVQGDVFISPWKSFAGKHAQLYIAGLEGRYYFDKAFSKWYVGANVSVGAYNIQKWNYWNDDFFVHKDGFVTDYINSNLYQKGFSFLLGATVGYQFKLNERLNMDLYLGAGTSQDFYKGYDKVSGDRYDNYEDPTRVWNRSGEIIPYRGGVMISYKIK